MAGNTGNRTRRAKQRSSSLPLRKRRDQQNSRGQRDLRIDNVRGFLIILVVVGHFLLPLQESNTRLITGILYVIYVFHMPCFVMLSGYYAKSVYKNGRFRWGKAVQMLWLYFVYEIIVFFTEGLAYGFKSHFPNFFRESGAPWYLLSLTLWYLTIPLFHGFSGKRSSAAIVLAMFPAVAFLKYVIRVGSFLCLDRTVSFLPFFYLGYFSTQNTLDRYLASRFKRPVDLAAVFLVLLVLVGARDLFFKYNLVVYGADYNRWAPDLYPRAWLIHLIWCVMAVVISLGLVGLMLQRRMFLVTELGRNTLQIYFLHRPIRDLLVWYGFFDRLDPFNRLHVLFLVAFSVGLTILLGIGYISEAFRRLRTVFDPLLEKHHAL